MTLHKYTTISITQFMGDLELSKKGFTAVNHPKERETFSEEELPKIKNYLFANIDIWNLGLILQFQTGMRIGEIAALKPGDIGTHCINVRRTEVKYKDEDGKWCVKVQEHTKTDAGYRCVILPPQAEETLAMIQKLNLNGEYLFMNNGKRIRENTFNKRLTGICDKLGIEHHSTHKIRKTYGTTLLDGNVTDGVIADQMGHKDISTTRQFYYYSNKSEKTKRDQITKAISF